MLKTPLKAPLAALCIVLMAVATLGVTLSRQADGVSRGYQYARGGLDQVESTLNLAYALVECGQYSYNGRVITSGGLEHLQNDQKFDHARASSDCSQNIPSYAPENGFSFMAAAAIALGADTPAEFGVAITVIRFLLIAVAGLLALPMAGSIGALVMTAGLLGWSYWDEAFFFESRLLMDYHFMEPYVWLISILISANALLQILRSPKLTPAHWVLIAASVFGMVYLRIFRSSNFYIQEVALALTAIAVLWVLYRAKRSLIAPAIALAVLVAGPMALGSAHAAWIEARTCAYLGGDPDVCAQSVVNVEHPILHPIVLGLAAPPSPISARFGFEWASDLETLKPAQFINPEVDRLYTPEFSKALRDFYVHIWTRHTGETVTTYLTKISALYSIGWPVVIGGILALAAAVALSAPLPLFAALLFAGKAFESMLIYPMYTPFFHHSAGLLAVLGISLLIFRPNSRRQPH